MLFAFHVGKYRRKLIQHIVATKSLVFLSKLKYTYTSIHVESIVFARIDTKGISNHGIVNPPAFRFGACRKFTTCTRYARVSHPCTRLT